MTFTQAFKDFVSNVSTPGLQRIFYPVSSLPTSRVLRGIWLIVWLSAAVIMTLQIREVINDYNERKTVSKVINPELCWKVQCTPILPRIISAAHVYPSMGNVALPTIKDMSLLFRTRLD